MPSNLSTIGFVFADEAQFGDAMGELAKSARERLSTPAGEYAIWRSRTGAEIWFHLAPAASGGAGEAGIEREIVGLTPFFEGRSEVPLKITEAIRRQSDNDFEGLLTAWVAPDETGEGAYPLSLDCVDFAAQHDADWPQERTARVSGFAREIKAHADEAAFAASREGDEGPHFAPRSFMPIGLFASSLGDDGETGEAAEPSPSAMLTGRVVEHATLVNEATGATFLWMLVESLEATYDVVADPVVVEGEIREGGIVEVVCWMFGRLLD